MAIILNELYGIAGKTLKNILYAGAFAAATSFLPGCEPEEPPVIEHQKILSLLK